MMKGENDFIFEKKQKKKTKSGNISVMCVRVCVSGFGATI